MFKVYQIFILFSGIFLVVSSHFSFTDDYGNRKDEPVNLVVNDDALFLTPYIETGQIHKAQELATVQPMLKNINSFSGYITVNKTTDSNLFFWLFKSQQGNWKKRPLVVWLHGGPGSSALNGLFAEVGPFSVTKQQKLKRRKYSWNKKYNILFIDNPIGTGFSFTTMDSGYARNEKDATRDLYEALVQLHELFPALRKNKLIVTGESYGGKLAATIAYKIYKMNENSAVRINVAGLVMGAGYIDPISYTKHASHLFNLGLIDESKRNELALKEYEIRANIRAGQFVNALDGDDSEYDEILSVTGIKRGHPDFVHDDVVMHGPEIAEFINNVKTKKAIHVGNYTFNKGKKSCYDHMKSDIMQSVKPCLEKLLTAEAFPIISYSGQLDIIIGYVTHAELDNSLIWPHAREYHKANRCQFRVGNEVAGYYKSAGSFTEVMIRNTGHLVTITQPKWTFQLLDRFITNSTSFKCDP